MKKMIIGSVLVLLANLWTSGAPLDTAQLKPKAVYGKEAKVIAYILDAIITIGKSPSTIRCRRSFLDEYVKTSITTRPISRRRILPHSRNTEPSSTI